jgi:hypothetical protein
VHYGEAALAFILGSEKGTSKLTNFFSIKHKRGRPKKTDNKNGNVATLKKQIRPILA